MSGEGTITARTVVGFMLATWPRRLALGLILLLPVVVAALGGFRVGDPPARAVAAGVPTDTGAYVVVPHAYFVSDALDAYGLDDGERWVGVLVELTSRASAPIYLTFDDETFRLPGSVPVTGTPHAYEALRLDTGRPLGDVQPGVSYEVALLWRTTGMQEPPPDLTLTMFRTAQRELSIESGYYLWRATEDSFEVTLPLAEAPPSILEEEE